MLQLRASGKTNATRLRDWLMTALAVCSGAVDAICFLGLGKVFTAFMTGNLVFLGTRIAGAPGPDAVSVCASLAGFMIGAWWATKILTPTRGSDVWPSRVTAALAFSVAANACFFGVWWLGEGVPSPAMTHLTLGASAVAMGLQTVAVRSLGVQGVMSTAATMTVTLLASDATRWTDTTTDHRLLVRVIAGLITGAIGGALLVLHWRRYAPLLPVGVSALVVVTAAIQFGGALNQAARRAVG